MRGSDWLGWLLLIFYILLAPQFLFVLATSLAAIIGGKKSRRAERTAPGGKPNSRRFLVVIPAHNEEGNIGETVQSCRAMRYPASSFEVLVLADNCTDRTAARARESHARVVERVDPDQKTKGHAIEYLIDKLIASGEFDALDAIVVIDADTRVDPGLLEQFALALERGADWVQCYDCVGNADQSWRTGLMALGFSLINGVTPAGQNALGLSAGLRGNGVCISTNGLRRVPWKVHGLAEDIEYSWTVRTAGGYIVFVKDAAVYATMLGEGGKSSANQRRRWEFGRSELRRSMLGPLLRSPHLGWLEKLAAVLELTMQPMSELIIIYTGLSLLLCLAIPGIYASHHYRLLTLLYIAETIATLAIVVHALSPFLLSFLPWRFAACYGYIPYYIGWKLVVLAGGRPGRWIRTTRAFEQAANPQEDRSQAAVHQPGESEEPVVDRGR
jgi:cellulose synthase/poly-beta-1,6-N-acetylglucosamine synthase-like glycosyltransferase